MLIISINSMCLPATSVYPCWLLYLTNFNTSAHSWHKGSTFHCIFYRDGLIRVSWTHKPVLILIISINICIISLFLHLCITYVYVVRFVHAKYLSEKSISLWESVSIIMRKKCLDVSGDVEGLHVVSCKSAANISEHRRRSRWVVPFSFWWTSLLSVVLATIMLKSYRNTSESLINHK